MKARNGAVDSRSPPPLTAAVNAAARHHPQSCWEQAKRLYLQTVKTVICGYILYDYCMSQIPPKNLTRPTKISQISSSWACGAGEVLLL
jgi:hypothetical protein